MSEDRNKHEQAGKGAPEGLGHKVGGRNAAEAAAGVSQYVPDKVRAEVDGTKAKTVKGKSGKRSR